MISVNRVVRDMIDDDLLPAVANGIANRRGDGEFTSGRQPERDLISHGTRDPPIFSDSCHRGETESGRAANHFKHARNCVDSGYGRYVVRHHQHPEQNSALLAWPLVSAGGTFDDYSSKGPPLGLHRELTLDPDEINRFKTDSEYAEDVEISSIHRVLERLRAAMNWGMAQTPPLFIKSPFHRFGVRLNKKAEIVRDRRLPREEEKRLLDTALGVMNTAAHRYVGELLHDRIVGALELCCRRGEMLLIQNKRVNWDTCQIGIPGATAKDRENRRIPFNPKGRLAAILKRRATLGPDAFVFGSVNGEHQPTIQTAWETLKLLANGIEPRSEKEGEEWNRQQLLRIDLRWHDLRHEGACRLHADGVDIRIIQLMLGHASIQQTQRYLNVTDEELRRGLEVSWKNQGRPLRLATGS